MLPSGISSRRTASAAALAGFILLAGCGEIDIRDGGILAGASYCQDMDGEFHFQVLIPPWKYNKEYKCTQMEGTECVGEWLATGRYVFVVSDIPFVNLDSEIVSLLNVELTSGDTERLAEAVIIDKDIGEPGSDAEFYGDEIYPRPRDFGPEGLRGHEVLWRERREYQGKTYNWYRRDAFLAGAGSRVYHLQLFSIDTLDKPEFDAILSSFREGVAPDGAPDCRCRDEHDPSGPTEC